MHRIKAKAFTLAELLIALAILGVIATFTIPKIISAQTDSRNKAVAREIIAMVSNAVYLAKTNGVLSATSTVEDLIPYMNYVAVDTTSTIDGIPPGSGSAYFCTPPYKCLRLHNGAVLRYMPGASFVSTGGGLSAVIDPDGQMTSKQDSLSILAFSDGRLITYGQVMGSSYDPAWFTW